MKLKIFVLFFTILSLVESVHAQTVFASTLKIGPFSLDMKNDAVDKIIGKKLSKAELKDNTENYEKMIDVNVGGVLYKLDFNNNYNKDGDLVGTYKLAKIKCNDAKVVTKSGIAIGMDKYDVLKKLDGMNIAFRFIKYSEYDNDGKPTNKFKEYIEISDRTAYSVLSLEIENSKITGFEVSYQEDGC